MVLDCTPIKATEVAEVCYVIQVTGNQFLAFYCVIQLTETCLKCEKELSYEELLNTLRYVMESEHIF